LTVSERETLFDDLKPLMTRVHSLVKASGAPASVLEDLNSFKRKLSGGGKSSKARPDAALGDAKPEKAPAKTRSSAQTSYDNQIGHFHGYLAVLQNIADYDPHEADLKLTALQSLRDALQTKNNAVSSASVLVSRSRGKRDELLYTGEDSIVSTALLGKNYVSAAFGKSTQIYKDVAALSFKRPRK